MFDVLMQPWPWYVTGLVIGLMVPLLLVITGKNFGISSSLRHACAAVLPGKASYFAYDWRTQGGWNIAFAAGIVLGGLIAGVFFANPEPIALSEATVADLAALGVQDVSGLVPADVFSWSNLMTLPGFLMIVGGGFLLGFGARYAGGCTSGHAIMGLATFQKPSLVAVLGFFIGGLTATYFVLPLLL